MEASLKLLNQYVKVDDFTADEVAAKLTSIGHEVEGMHVFARGDKLVVGYVQDKVAHPDSDHLNVCQVEIAPGVVNQIVCGAPNVDAGQKVIVALPGCDLGDGFKIKESHIRGVESNGMICSIAELGIEQRLLKEEDKAGIHVLDSDAPIGVDALKYMGYDDTVLEIGLTPNRSDCMAMISLAYEVGALLNREVKVPKMIDMDELDSEITVEVKTDLCPFFGAKLVKGVITKESPEWLRTALLASGMKPINNIVDISNFVMIETGQPIHMYDYDKLKTKGFVIKTGFQQKAILLDGQEYDILPEDIIVSTDDGIGCVAGVMGSNDTKIDENTVNIVIEAATFNGANLRNTARRLNLLTDASQHYIKGAIDTANTERVLNRCASLLKDLADAKEIYKSVTTPYTPEKKIVTLTTTRVNGLLGTKISTDDIADIFTRLHFDYTLDEESFTVTVPTYRNDMTMAADLIEEVARMYGYDYIPSTLPYMEMTKGALSPVQDKTKFIRHLLADLGLHEVMTYTLTSPTMVNDFNLFHKADTIELMMPLGEERSVTRKSVIPSLLQAINFNNSHANKDVCIYELSHTYSKDTEIQTLSIACSGMYHTVPWLQQSQKADFYLVKGFVETIFKKLCIEESRYTLKPVEENNQYFHPGRSGYIVMGKDIVGVIGEIHPRMAKKYDVKDTYVAELNLSVLLNLKTRALKFTPIPQFPSVTRDIALVMNQDIPTYDVVRTIQKASKRLISKTQIFDVYVGEHIDEGKKSVAIALTFQDSTKTLDETTINEVMEQILEAVTKEYDAHLRA
ncbi:phenylalanine--tRNA ligase subunit beta [Candidatus Stoquefichus massiliensis]|uniref:phenylalanine--tRNA ligase subunit beta n=1 Tax=Candidatus Stoquefichus massiliensis TaxID=1470350 RepID=UPI000486FB33|nr:phenylalanine--tRNA ligase subunit beta [Candidatus Stoquefichus massiliensis]